MPERTITTRVKVTGADQYRRDMKKVSDGLKEASTSTEVMKGILKSDIIKKGLQAIVDGLKNSVNASMEFQEALTGVAKTSTMSDSALYYFGEDLKTLATQMPITTTELANIAEAAGQLGIADEDILEFTTVMARMGYTTNMASIDAATAFARIANIFGTDSSNFSRMGSTVVDLGNNFATTESEITDMTLALAGYAKMAGFSEANTMAISTALSSVGIEAEAGSTAIGTIMSNITKAVALNSTSLVKYAAVAGMSAGEFASAWKTDAMGAFQTFIEGMQKGEAAGKSTLLVLDELGIKNVRQTKAMTALVSSADLLPRTVEKANQAWKENTALTDEAAKKEATLASQMQMLNNDLNNLGIEVGNGLTGMVSYGVDAAKSAVDAARNLIGGTKNYTQIAESAQNAYDATVGMVAENERFAKGALESLEGLDTESEQYAQRIKLLTQYFPSLNQYVTEDGKQLTVSTDAMYGYVEAAAEAQREQAKLAMLQSKADAYVYNSEHLEESKAQLATLEAISQSLHMVDEQMNDLSPEELEALYGEDWMTYWNSITGPMNDVDIAIAQLSEDIAQQEADVASGAAAWAEYQKAVESAKAAASGNVIEGGYVAGTDERTDAFVNRMQEYILIADELETAYLEARASVQSTLDSIVQGFQAVWGENEDMSYSDGEITENLQEQMDYLTRYREMIQQLKDMGFTDEDLNTLGINDGSKESFRVLTGLTEGTAEEAQAIIDKYEAVRAEEEALVSDLAGSQVELETNLDSIVDEVNTMVDEINQQDAASEAGRQTIQGYINGLNGMIPLLTAKARQVKNLMDLGGGGSTPHNYVEYSPDGSHSQGLGFVPYDNYLAQLHKGEMVLTALEARAYRAERSAGYDAYSYAYGGDRNTTNTTNNNFASNVNISGVVVRSDSDIEKLSREIAQHNRRVAMGYGGK